MPHPSQETAVIALENKIYVVGGFTGSQTLGAVQIFDISNCTWSMGPALPKAVHHANVAELDGRLYVLGSLEGPSFSAIADVWSWNPATEAGWTPHTPMLIPRGSAVTAALGGQIYVAGGLTNDGPSAAVSTFTPATDSWSDASALPRELDHGCGGVIDDTLYVIGGRRGTISSASSFVHALDVAGAWTERAPMPSRRAGTACGVIADRIIVVGGEGNPESRSGVFPNVEAYTPTLDAWEVLKPMPTPRHGMGAAVWGERLYVPGGAVVEGFGAVATHEVLTP